LNYISHFYKKCVEDRKILNERLKKDPTPWTEAHTQAIRNIKAKVRRLPILHVSDDNLLKIVETDASNIAWGAVLKQINLQKKEEVIQFASGLWQAAKKNYSTLKKKIKDALNVIQKFELYLIYKRFILKTDAAAMNKILHKELKSSGDHKFARWQALFSNFDFSIEHIKGISNSLADFLSREHLQILHQSFIVSVQIRGDSKHIENISDMMRWNEYCLNWVPRWGLRSTQVIAPTTQTPYQLLVPEVRHRGNSNLLAPIISQGNRKATEAQQALTESFHHIDLIWKSLKICIRNIFVLIDQD
jgi:hypothetical protein